ncbi:MAG: SRPBCC family protein [Sandaracinaceae bacterium]|nr:SRPBCC family protein [Sandaracinaceae bacterium]
MRRWAPVVLGLVIASVAVMLVGVALVTLMPPTEYRITRSRTIEAPRAVVLAQLEDVRAYDAWEPWRRQGTHATYSPSTRGPGAWVERSDGSSSARTTIRSVSAERVEMDNATNGSFGARGSDQSFELRAIDDAHTEVQWVLHGELSGLPRALWPLVDLPGRVEPEMEAALARLDRAAHAAASSP